MNDRPFGPGYDQARRDFLRRLDEAGGEIDIKTMEKIQGECRGMVLAALVRWGQCQWIRGRAPRSLTATGIRITDAGRAAIHT